MGSVLAGPTDCAVNFGVVPDEEEEDKAGNAKFIHVPPTCQGGFDLIDDGNNEFILTFKPCSNSQFPFEQMISKPLLLIFNHTPTTTLLISSSPD
jgi:hypothetical protein